MVKKNNIPIEQCNLRILQSLRRIIRAVDQHSRKLISDYNITSPQLMTLLILAENGPMGVAKIAETVHLSPSTMVGILDRLEAKGYITRERSIEDRRSVVVNVTKEGLKFIKNAPSPLQDKLAESLKNLPELEQSTIALSLERIVNLMEVEHVDASPILETAPISDSK